MRTLIFQTLEFTVLIPGMLLAKIISETNT